MTIRRRLTLLAATLAVVTWTSTGCTSTAEPAPRPPQPSTQTTSHAPAPDGAVAIAVVNSWVQAARSGNGEVACGFGTPRFQKALRAQAANQHLTSAATGCPQAVAALANQHQVPAPVDRFRVTKATRTTTHLTLIQGQQRRQVIVNNVDGTWLIDQIRDQR